MILDFYSLDMLLESTFGALRFLSMSVFVFVFVFGLPVAGWAVVL